MISYFLLALLRHLPMLILAVVGIVFAAVRWKRHPRVSLLTIAGLGIYLIDFLVYTGIRYALPSMMEALKLPPDSIATISTVIVVSDDFVYAAVIILLVAAAFTGRNRELADA